MKRSTGSRWNHAVRAVLGLTAGLLLIAAAPAVAQVDLSVAGIVQPSSGCALTAFENVTVRIFNYGATLPAGTSFNVSYTINAGAPVTEMVTLGGNLFSHSTFNYTFTTPADVSTPGTYSFDATVSIAGDVNPANSAYTGYVVTDDAPSVGGTVSTPPAGSSGTLTLGGNTGAVVQWEQSDDGGQRWQTLSNTGAAQAYANVRVVTQFRARVRNGRCPDALSAAGIVVP